MLGQLQWHPRPHPLDPIAAVGWGRSTAVALGRRLLELSDDILALYRGVAGPEVLLVLDPRPHGPDIAPANAEPTAAERPQAPPLPWVDGVHYLGWDPGAPGLLLPTHSSPSAPGELLSRALSRRAGPGQSPLAVLPDPPRIVPAGSARPIDRSSLTRWLAQVDS
ncbi:MAG: hypothetical protein ACE366_20040 [Bradymonadia bacterium]